MEHPLIVRSLSSERSASEKETVDRTDNRNYLSTIPRERSFTADNS